jgi:hypothetical protein
LTSAIALAPACDRVVNLTPLQDARGADAGIDALRGVDGALDGLPDGGIGDGPGLPDATSTLDGPSVPSRSGGDRDLGGESARWPQLPQSVELGPIFGWGLPYAEIASSCAWSVSRSQLTT